MNTKNIILISSIITVLGLTIALVLEKLTIETFGVISGLILTSLYGLYQKFENIKVINEKLELENEIKSYEFTIANRNETLKEKNILLGLKDAAINTLTEDYRKKDKEIKSQENKLKELLIKDTKVIDPIIEDFKDEAPKVIKRQYNKKKK